MRVYVVDSKLGASIYVLADNRNNAIYKAYNKAIAKTKSIPSNEGFEKWRKGIDNVRVLNTIEIDTSRFNIY